ncbi:zinc finger CCCH domain-containing protein 14-like [Gossypium australe]|uniref:Zinc finger CCCH domain-containing protein 14-like n=1 Tax=Gossypium australe TaxID=47621 RepID=A0A5B6X817_9ROSI|nr:zinc finger CCCH domain-containing protein 14-like [Gossypium australe]
MTKENTNHFKKRTPLITASNSIPRSSVSKKLLHLLRRFNYTSDSIQVLTEYVVVLVSNGKSQSEANSELEPFLGDTTTELWDVLSEGSNGCNASKSSSDLENTTGPSSSDVDDASAGKKSQKSGPGSVPYCRFRVFSTTLDEEMNEYASTFYGKSNENLRAFENNQHRSLNGCSFKTKPSAEIVLSYEQNVQCGNVHHANPLFKRSQVTNVGGRRLFSSAADAIFHQNGTNRRTHGYVWDRLGKLDENDTSVKIQVNENIKRPTSEQKSLGFGQTTLIPTVQVGKVNQNPSRYYNMNTYRTNGGRKRQLNDFIPISPTTSDTQDHEEEMSRTFTRHPEKHTLMLKESDALYESKSCNKSLKSGFDASLRSRPEKTSQEKLGVEARESTQTLISVGAFPAETGGVRPVKAQLVDMKLRLQKLEREICMLKSMPRNKDRYHALSSSSGSVDPLKEGVESRTVFVTNVATQDALRSYFSNCGSINRVIKLTDTSTIAQKWSAYITFANKESVDKALALNGTNFFSRIIWVRKAGKVTVKPTHSQHGRQRNAIFQQKHSHDPNVPQQMNYVYDAHDKSHKSTETVEHIDAEL